MTLLDAERAVPVDPPCADQSSKTQRDREYGRFYCTPQKARQGETVTFDGNPGERAVMDRFSGNHTQVIGSDALYGVKQGKRLLIHPSTVRYNRQSHLQFAVWLLWIGTTAIAQRLE